MSEWFDERYISRAEHQQIVDYYRNLVAQLHRQVRALRSQEDARTLDNLVEHGRRKAEREMRRLMEASLTEHGGNVIKVDFTRRRA
jgi:hypothetical protein